AVEKLKTRTFRSPVLQRVCQSRWHYQRPSSWVPPQCVQRWCAAHDKHIQQSHRDTLGHSAYWKKETSRSTRVTPCGSRQGWPRLGRNPPEWSQAAIPILKNPPRPDDGTPATASPRVAPENTSPHTHAQPLTDQRPCGRYDAVYATAPGPRSTTDQ